LFSLIALSFMMTITSCGGGGSSSGSHTADQGTPAGTSTVTIAASIGSLIHTTNLTLSIQ
jgi:hypothetical protein